MPHRREYRRPATSSFTYVSSCVKYLIFVLNFIFWLFGGLLIGIGLYAFVDKWQLTGWVKLDNVYDVILNVSLVMVLMGGVIFIVSFAGCVGALRENTCLLKFVIFP
jgi:tetraspanin-33